MRDNTNPKGRLRGDYLDMKLSDFVEGELLNTIIAVS